MRKCQIITVGPNEPHSFKLAGATHESCRDDVPIVVAELFAKELVLWYEPKPPAKPKKAIKRRRKSLLA